MVTPRWVEDVHRTKVVGQKSDDMERIRGNFTELRLRYIKVVGDNITLRNALISQKRRRRPVPRREYEQENEIAPGAPSDDQQEDLVEYTERLQRKREDW